MLTHPITKWQKEAISDLEREWKAKVDKIIAEENGGYRSRWLRKVKRLAADDKDPLARDINKMMILITILQEERDSWKTNAINFEKENTRLFCQATIRTEPLKP